MKRAIIAAALALATATASATIIDRIEDLRIDNALYDVTFQDIAPTPSQFLGGRFAIDTAEAIANALNEAHVLKIDGPSSPYIGLVQSWYIEEQGLIWGWLVSGPGSVFGNERWFAGPGFGWDIVGANSEPFTWAVLTRIPEPSVVSLLLLCALIALSLRRKT